MSSIATRMRHLADLPAGVARDRLKAEIDKDLTSEVMAGLRAQAAAGVIGIRLLGYAHAEAAKRGKP
jgi:hypothetical protein